MSQPEGPEKEKAAADGKKPGGEAPSGRAAATDKPSPEERIKERKDPVTNQDEQGKITNAGDQDIPIAEK